METSERLCVCVCHMNSNTGIHLSVVSEVLPHITTVDTTTISRKSRYQLADFGLVGFFCHIISQVISWSLEFSRAAIRSVVLPARERWIQKTLLCFLYCCCVIV